MKNFERFISMVVEYGSTHERFFREVLDCTGKMRLKSNNYITSDGIFLGKAMENVRNGKLLVDAEQKRRLEAIGFYAPQITLEHRANMQEEMKRLHMVNVP